MHVPVANRLSVVPATVHTVPVVDENATVRPLETVAVSGDEACRMVNDAGALNFNDWFTLVTEMDFVTDDAAAYVSLPSWLAVTVHVPGATSVSVDSATVHTVAVDEDMDTGRPLVAVAENG